MPFTRGDDDLIEESEPVLKELLHPDGGCESLPIPPVAQKDAVWECDVLAEMNTLKTKAHTGLSKNRLCLVCGERAWNLSDHLEKNHPEEDVQAVDDACFFCRKIQKPRVIAPHFLIVHRERAAMPDEATRMAALDFMRRTGFLQYRCVRCKKIFPKKHLLDLHSIIHSPDQADQPERKCSECPFLAETFLDVVKHTAKHQKWSRKIRTPCLLCGVGVRVNLRDHMESNHPDEMKLIMATWKFQCPECRHQFARKFDLNVHASKVNKGWQKSCISAPRFTPTGGTRRARWQRGKKREAKVKLELPGKRDKIQCAPYEVRKTPVIHCAMMLLMKRPTTPSNARTAKSTQRKRLNQTHSSLEFSEFNRKSLAFETFEDLPEILHPGKPRIAEDVLTSVCAYRDFKDFVKLSRQVATKFHQTTYRSLIKSYEDKWKPADDLIILEGKRSKRRACESKIELVQDAHQACGLSFYVMDDVSEKNGPPAGGSSLELDNDVEGLPEIERDGSLLGQATENATTLASCAMVDSSSLVKEILEVAGLFDTAHILTKEAAKYSSEADDPP
ncbi:uncharacterized protein LOC129585537 [Paramacrobiotus metropolitanus]|uniref:uncharacterized protein LOC129585537 n=1 Tax=Paramacrobiotus metropolitanus TaxID=2943436 RepID=UPI002445CA72|nr:uncharacterized protein LOC129585537 [Paramacrobiotus metropolitanus]